MIRAQTNAALCSYEVIYFDAKRKPVRREGGLTFATALADACQWKLAHGGHYEIREEAASGVEGALVDAN